MKEQFSTPAIMGIVNVTPDSFSDGGQFQNVQEAVDHGLRLVEEGADILDIGGESTRPGAKEVSSNQEIERILPVIEGLKERLDIPLSIDTRKPQVAKIALKAGASIWNNVSALTFSPESLLLAADCDCKIILMHAQGTPEHMQENPYYDDVVEEVFLFLQNRIHACHHAGIDPARLIIDPGIGFGKMLNHNLSLLKNLRRFVDLGYPVLLGASRKRFIEEIAPDTSSGPLTRGGTNVDRLGGSIAAALIGAINGVSIVRVHDVRQTRQALLTVQAIDRGSDGAVVLKN